MLTTFIKQQQQRVLWHPKDLQMYCDKLLRVTAHFVIGMKCYPQLADVYIQIDRRMGACYYKVRPEGQAMQESGVPHSYVGKKCK